MKRHALIIAHPNAWSFTSAVAHAYRDEALARGHEVIERELYRMAFDPRLGSSEIPGHKEFAPGTDVLAERQQLEHIDVFAFFYPLWLNSPPAILKGYMERVFGFGFAYGRNIGGNTPLLEGRQMISFSSSGAPQEWLASTGNWEAMRTLFDRHFATVCGLEVLDHVHFGRVVPGMRADAVTRHLDVVRAAVRQYFLDCKA